MSVWSDLKESVSGLFGERKFGDRGEQAAERFLRRKCRLTVIERSYKNFVGEIDLIAIDTRTRPRTIVFVEVKTRKSDWQGLPVEAVDEKKQRQVSATAMVWLKQHDLLENRYRFDVVGILWPDDSDKPTIEYYENAFQSGGSGQMFS
jgi:putative endonuclease